MEVKINHHIITKIHMDPANLEELVQVEKLYNSVLDTIFLDNPILIITISPEKKVSIGYEFDSYKEMRIDKSLLSLIKSALKI